MDARYLDLIKRFEGYQAEAKWDYAQFTNGYGTKAAYAGEVIGRQEAERRFNDELATAAALVDRFAQGLDDGTRAALTSLTFNAGTKWMRSGLGAAVREGDLDRARQIFVQYTKAGGVDLPGLTNRRLEEVTWFGGGGFGSSSKLAAADTTSSPDAMDSNTAVQAAPGQRVIGAEEVRQERDAARFFEEVEMEQLRLLLLRSDLVQMLKQPDRDSEA